MKTQTNDPLYQTDGEKKLIRPAKCSPECVQFPECMMPKKCQVLYLTRQAQK